MLGAGEELKEGGEVKEGEGGGGDEHAEGVEWGDVGGEDGHAEEDEEDDLEGAEDGVVDGGGVVDEVAGAEEVHKGGKRREERQLHIEPVLRPALVVEARVLGGGEEGQAQERGRHRC